MSTLDPLNSLSNLNIKYLISKMMLEELGRAVTQKTLEKLAKTRVVSAPYILVSVLVVFHLLNAKALVVSEITEAQT